MDYNTEKLVKIVNLYHMLTNNDAAYLQNEVGNFLKNELFPALGDESYESTDVLDLLRETNENCQAYMDNVSRIKGKSKHSEIIYDHIAQTAGELTNYNDKPLVSQLVCLWYIISTGETENQKKVVEILKETWNIRDDILADIADTYVTLKELNEGSQKAVSYTPKNSFSFIMKNLFRRKKYPENKNV